MNNNKENFSLYINCISQLEELLNKDKYLSKKDYYSILDKYNSEVFNNIESITEPNIKNKLKYYLNEMEQLVSKHNQNYINNKLIEYKEYFDNIFKDIDPNIILDEEQRKAILIDEDYSLVIAGAGSGKTTTMTAKAKYLIEKQKIDPKEIVILSFTKKAVGELEDRVNNDFNLGIKVKTFHKLGLEILNDRLEKKVRAIEDGKKKEILYTYFKEHIFKDKQKLANIMAYFSSYLYLEPEALTYPTFDSYWEFYTNKIYNKEKEHLSDYNKFAIEVRESSYRTIKNEYVNSKHEVIIANFLFKNNINYKYEEKYKQTETKFQYLPDFTIEMNGKTIYLEFYGLSKYYKNGSFSKESTLNYKNIIRKKKMLHEKYGTDLIELYPDNSSDTTNYLTVLKQELEKRGIYLETKTEKEVFLKLMETSVNWQIFNFIKLLIDFISKFKSKNYTARDFVTLINKTDNTLLKGQLSIVHEIYTYYNQSIHDKYLVDFEDMINYAYRYMKEKPLNNSNLKYKYIIVDEYQDISTQRFNLLKTISEVFNAKIIGVGDDWQAIFGFSGSEIQLFTNFCNLMGYGEIIKITNTYRNSQELIDIAGEFVLKNSNQFDKHLTSPKHLENPIEILYFDNKNKLSCSELLENVLDKIYINNPNHTVLLLGRYKKDIENILANNNFKEGIKKENQILYLKHIDMKIQFLTIHSSKGLGFDQTIILNAIDGEFGFPSKRKEDELLAILNNDNEYEENIEYAEERRLFYVAITRTKNKVYILTPNKRISEFILEIKNYNNVVELFKNM